MRYARPVRRFALGLAAVFISTVARAGDFEVGSSLGYGSSMHPDDTLVAVGGAGSSLGTSAAVTFFQRFPVTHPFGKFGGGPIARVFGGYRVFSGLLSVGLAGGGRLTSASAGNTVDYDRRLGLSIGPYMRLYPASTRVFEPWLSIGAEYAVERLTYRVPGSALGDFHFTHHGIALPIGVGVDYRASSIIAFGPAFQLTHVRPLAACVDGIPGSGSLDPNTGTARGDSGCTTRWDLRALPYTTWSVSLGVRVSL
jgi:hypothetical protein